MAGILGSAYNTNGPPIVVYGALCRWPPERFRATLQCYFFPTGLVILLSHGLAGLWTRDVLQLYGAALPVIMLAIWVGQKLNHIVSQQRFERLVYTFLVIIGLLLIV